MVQKIALGAAFIVLVCSSAKAQVYGTQYRPPGQQWQQLTTPHFKLLFSRENETAARYAGAILENNYSLSQQLVGGALSGFPVILNSYNDRSNGFVTPFHFRSEIELPPIKGKSLNPQTGGWMENVAPHELVHALQFSNIGRYNLPWLVSLFSPDLARSFHGAIPSGVTEGLAVHYETKSVAPGGGRGNYPFFTRQFDAVFNSSDRWSMGQMLQNPSATRPFNRHYIGGYEFTSWLQEIYGSETSQNALDFYMDFPFLGYGVALWHVTGSWPGQLYQRFEQAKQQAGQEAQNRASQMDVRELSIPYKGREIRRPKWLSDSTLVFYGSFYNARPGFYQYDLNTHQAEQLLTTGSVGDYRYDLSDDRSKLIYSYYDSDAIYDNTYKAELVEYDMNKNQSRQLTKNGRLYAPLYVGGERWSLQTRPASSALVTVEKEPFSPGSAPELLSLGKHEITAVAAEPNDRRLAVVANKNGLQGLWIVTPGRLQAVKTNPPDISFEKGSVFDPEWHPTGKKLLFSSDVSGSLQLYEYGLDEEKVVRLTDAPYNAFEGSYSPDGKRLAFIRQVKNERLPAVMSLAETSATAVPAPRWRPNDEKAAAMHQSVAGDSLANTSKNWTVHPYKAGATWLKPRAFFPLIKEMDGSNSYQYGLSMHSNNLLQSQAYSAELSYLENRFWYDLRYENKQFFPGFRLGLESEPSYFAVADENQNSFRLLRQHRSFSADIPVNIRFNQNVFSTSLYLEPELRYSQLRFFELGGGGNSSNFANSLASNIYGQFNYRLQQNIRDVQPNSGLIFYSELEHFWSSTDLRLGAGERRLDLSLQQPTALRGGVVTYLSPLRSWNQSLRLELEGLTQSGLVFNNQSLVSDGFSETVLPRSQNMLSFNTRYTIPLLYADNGGFLLPLYLDNIYLVAFSDTITDPGFSDWYRQSRTVFGLGLRTRFRLSNLTFDVGVGYGYEASRRKHQFFIGAF